MAQAGCWRGGCGGSALRRVGLDREIEASSTAPARPRGAGRRARPMCAPLEPLARARDLTRDSSGGCSALFGGGARRAARRAASAFSHAKQTPRTTHSATRFWTPSAGRPRRRSPAVAATATANPVAAAAGSRAAPACGKYPAAHRRRVRTAVLRRGGAGFRLTVGRRESAKVAAERPGSAAERATPDFVQCPAFGSFRQLRLLVSWLPRR